MAVSTAMRSASPPSPVPRMMPTRGVWAVRARMACTASPMRASSAPGASAATSAPRFVERCRRIGAVHVTLQPRERRAALVFLVDLADLTLHQCAEQAQEAHPLPLHPAQRLEREGHLALGVGHDLFA